MSCIIDEAKIHTILTSSISSDDSRVREILAKARECRGLDLAEVAVLMQVVDPELLEELFQVARQVKEEIYGKRIVIFAPLYISNVCFNECLYCAFRVTNRFLKRHTLNLEQINDEANSLIQQGHKRILLVAGEAYPDNDFTYVLDAIRTIYDLGGQNDGAIRRINVNLAPLSVDEFRLLREAAIGTYQLFQETYHRDTYAKMHVAGKKTDYHWRLGVFDRALSVGIDDIGLGVLFGLYDWRFEVLALLAHSKYLEEHFSVGPHTISVPRLEPAFGSEIASNPPYAVSDIDFCKIIAILRLALPACGIILSTREELAMRRQALTLGVSQISAGSRASPGGYAARTINYDASQFALGDCRSLDEVIYDLIGFGYVPSFCTACYRLGRTGEDFMVLAKHGKIKSMCTPNALTTFAEYLNNYACHDTKIAGEKLLKQILTQMSPDEHQLATKLLARVQAGESDVFV